MPPELLDYTGGKFLGVLFQIVRLGEKIREPADWHIGDNVCRLNTIPKRSSSSSYISFLRRTDLSRQITPGGIDQAYYEARYILSMSGVILPFEDISTFLKARYRALAQWYLQDSTVGM